MLIKSVIINNIHYINLITLNTGTEIEVRLIRPCVLYAVKYGKCSTIHFWLNFLNAIDSF